jgi:cardiolipin synthase
MPYGDNPLDIHRVGQRVYLDILNRARKSVSIMTPYLILDGETENALKYAAARGVKVQLILPGIPDKKIPYALAKTHYKGLLDAGVEVYEYIPGFVHAKVFLADDREAVVGTINLDYRSLYHHFECATWMWGTDCIRDIREDFDQTLPQCRRVTAECLKQENASLRLIGYLFKLFAPLL